MNLDFDKMDGLVPAIIQDAETRVVLMLGFMNKEAFEQTMSTVRLLFIAVLKIDCGQRGRRVGIS